MHRHLHLPALLLAAAASLTACSANVGSPSTSSPPASSSTTPGGADSSATPVASVSQSPECVTAAEQLGKMSSEGTAAFTALMAGKTADALSAADAAEASAKQVLATISGVSEADKAAYLSTFATLHDVINAHANTPLDQAAASEAIAPLTAKSSEQEVAGATSNISAAYDKMCPNAAAAASQSAAQSNTPTPSDGSTTPAAGGN